MTHLSKSEAGTTKHEINIKQNKTKHHEVANDTHAKWKTIPFQDNQDTWKHTTLKYKKVKYEKRI